jgi:hypothetical protein
LTFARENGLLSPYRQKFIQALAIGWLIALRSGSKSSGWASGASMTLSTTSKFPDPAAAYRLIVEAHRGLGEVQRADFDAALILILADQIGSFDVLRQAIALAQCRAADAGQQQQQQQQ